MHEIIPHITTTNQAIAAIVITVLFLGLAYMAIDGWYD